MKKSAAACDAYDSANMAAQNSTSATVLPWVVLALASISMIALWHYMTVPPDIKLPDMTVSSLGMPAAVVKPDERQPVADSAKNRSAVVPESQHAQTIPVSPPANNIHNDQIDAHLADVLAELVQLISYRQQTRLSEEELNQVQQLLKQLFAQEAAVLPVLEDFFISGTDVAFIDSATGELSSLRLLLLKYLLRIDDIHTPQLALMILNTTVQPSELALLGRYFERVAPDQYRAELVRTAQELLDQATLYEVEQLGPLFQILSEYGAISTADLNTMPDYLSHYVSVALALLPDGQGLSALLQNMPRSAAAVNSEQGRLTLQLLAQSADHPLAAAELLQVARRGDIPERLWPDIAALLAGQEHFVLQRPTVIISRYVINRPEGTQVFYRAQQDTTQDHVSVMARLSVIEELLDANLSAAAQNALLSRWRRLHMMAESFH